MNPTNTFAWIITIGLWALALIFGSCALTACGDSPFIYEAEAVGVEGGLPQDDAGAAPDAPDAGPDRIVPPPKRDAETDGGSTEDAAPEADASQDAGCAPAPTVAECIPSGADAGIPYSIPDQYCVWLYDHALNPPATPVVMMMPAACRCDYTEGCLAGSGANICPAGSTYYAGGIFETDAGASRIVCQQ
jgi:hypothetical protein